jgi:hypothetical protein
MRTKLGVVVVALGVVCWGPATFAHHSFAVEYDRNKPVTLMGVVTKIEWTNPHARFYVDVVGENGEVTNYNFEMATPSVLSRAGWTRESLRPGDEVTVEGFGARLDTPRVAASSVTLSNGRSLFSGPNDGYPADPQ